MDERVNATADDRTAPPSVTVPEWARDMTDLHAHAAPSLLPRHGDDAATTSTERDLGFTVVVLKSHEGSTVERAAVAGPDVYGGVVLNSAIGGANPDAVEVAARLGGRVVWMPTVSSRTHKAGASNPELSVHRGFELRPVDVFDDERLRPEWYDVLDVIAEHDLLLASGHLSADETATLFEIARQRGVRRLMVNHPKMAFLGWNDHARQRLVDLGAHLELGILPDLLGAPENASVGLVDEYPLELLVFGADLGHAHHPGPRDAVPTWLRALEKRVGEQAAHTILGENGRTLLLP
jgi:hypothetical protein